MRSIPTSSPADRGGQENLLAYACVARTHAAWTITRHITFQTPRLIKKTILAYANTKHFQPWPNLAGRAHAHNTLVPNEQEPGLLAC